MKQMNNLTFHTFSRILFTLSLFGLSQWLIAQSQDLTIYLSSLPSTINISIKTETSNGQSIFEQNPNEQVPSASIIKIPILIALMQQIEAGKIQWQEKYLLKDTDKVGGAGNIQFQESGISYTIKSLALEMIKESDNTATNILINKVGMNNVNQLIGDLGLKQTKLHRLMMDFEAIKEGRQNYTSATDMNQLFKLLLNQQLLSKKWSKKAIKVLEQCADDNTIPSLLPKKTKIAHKTGALNYIRGDSGIIFQGNNTIIISIFVENFSSFEEAEGNYR